VRRIKQFGQFWRDLKREGKGQHRATLEGDLLPVIDALRNDAPLALRACSVFFAWATAFEKCWIQGAKHSRAGGPASICNAADGVLRGRWPMQKTLNTL